VPAPERAGCKPFAYALLRVVPRVERGERLNVGVVLYSRQHDFLDLRTDVDAARLVAPSSTIIQPSEVHTGLTDDPAATLERLFTTLVR
jgi:hypothetical protein